MPGFLSTHPLEAERIKNVQTMLQPGDTALARKPEAYLQAVNNVVYGDDPRQGYVEGSMFYHPGMRFQFAIPAGWKVDNTPAQVTLVAADQASGLIFTGGKSDETAEQFGRKQATEIQNSGGKLLNEGASTINGLTCFEQAFTVTQQDQSQIQLRRSYVKKSDMVYVFSAISPVASFSKYDADFRQVVGSFRDLTNPAYINRAPKRLALVKANGTDNLQAIFKKAGMPEKSWPQFAVWNGLEAAAVPPAGKLIKIVK
jgi:predicted Zn-dependent protease